MLSILYHFRWLLISALFLCKRTAKRYSALKLISEENDSKTMTINYIDKVSFFFIKKIFTTFVFAHSASTTAKGKQKQQIKQKKKKATTTSSINFTGIHSVYFSLDRPKVLRNDKTSQRISTLHNQPVNYSRSQLLNLRTKFSILDDLF